MNTAKTHTPLVIKPCNAVQLAKAYGVSKKVLYRWLLPYQNCIGLRSGHKFSIEQVIAIIERIGLPAQSIK